MDFANIPLITLMRQKMSFLSARQNVLSQNIANADTPDYRALDIKKPDFGAELAKSSARLGMTVTQPQHIRPITGLPGFETIKRPTTYETTPNKNNVSIEEETMKMAQGQMDYQTVTNLYRKTVEIFRAAIGSRS